MTPELKRAEAHTILPAERLGDTLLVTPHGDLGGYSPTVFHSEFQHIQQILDDPGIKNLILDLSGSRYFGSEMIGALVAMREKVIDRGRTVIVEATRDTLVGLEVIKADTLFEFMDTRSTAISKVASMSVGQRVYRHRKLLKGASGLVILLLVAVIIYATGAFYLVFGSRPARTYEQIAKAWITFEKFHDNPTIWTGEEERIYRAETLEKLEDWEEDLESDRLFKVREDFWMLKAIKEFHLFLHGDLSREKSFEKYMGYARYNIQRRTGLTVTKVGPESLMDLRPPPEDVVKPEDSDSSVDSDAEAIPPTTVGDPLPATPSSAE